MGEGHAYSTYELPILKLIKYIVVCGLAGFLVGWLMRYTNADYLIALGFWQVFILEYWMITIPALTIMLVVIVVFSRKKP